MMEEKWEKLDANKELLKGITTQSVRKRENKKSCYVFDFNGVLVEKDITPKINAVFREKILLLFDPLRAKTDDEIRMALQKKGLRISADSDRRMIDTLAEFVADECFSPAKGTPARKTVYDLAETLLESGELKITAYPDAQPFLEHVKSKQYRVLLSRGSLSLLTKSCKASGLFEHVDEIETTIPHGNAKTAETFIRFAFEQQKKGRWIQQFLEDEFEAIQELILANVWMQKHGLPSFHVVWVDRDNELATRQNEVKQLENWISGKGIKSRDVLVRIETFKDYNVQ